MAPVLSLLPMNTGIQTDRVLTQMDHFRELQGRQVINIKRYKKNSKPNKHKV